ncbi:hypothetical protein [Desulfosporosinus shakirovi]|uniref:hypothetical protein n=1 Tax=Desulfosporosinus shakirovi TaxID=2885154 RepID=UPI001E42A1F3|nr:hypothetical protein [Desulfosporosinus sp. SRJS8]MCB8818202.1 hypothetical protein [Desulfosporosinus sp. SRJS8]
MLINRLKRSGIFVGIIALVIFSMSSMVTATVKESTPKDGVTFTANKVGSMKASNIEYVKISDPAGNCTEIWTDLANLQSRSDSYDSEGLQNITIVKEQGRRVIVIGNVDGKVDTTTWLIPDKIASENKILLGKSIFKSVKDDIKQNWILGEEKTLNGKTLLVYRTLDVDSETGLPIARHDSLTRNDKKVEGTLSEIYMSPSEVPENLFDPYPNISPKEVTAPFVDKN